MKSRSDIRRVTAREFAKQHGITAAAVRKWVERKGIRPIGKCGTANEYRESDLLAVLETPYDREHHPRSADGRFRPVGRS